MEIGKPELEHRNPGRNLDGPLNMSLHSCRILRWLIGLQIRDRLDPGENDRNCLLVITHRHVKREEILISRKPHIYGGK